MDSMAFGLVARVLRRIRTTVDAFDFSTDSELESMVAVVYHRMVEWFGPPTDSGRRVKTVRGPFTALGRDRLNREYVLIVSAELSGKDQQLAAIAHEVLHRVASGHMGLGRELWVAEMLALRSEQHILREHGWSPYADALMDAYLRDPCALSARELRTAKQLGNPLRTPFGLRRWPHPLGLTSGAAVLGETLERQVGWSRLCAMVRCRTLGDWLRTLPSDRLPPVRSVLGLD
jgi:hypothetical protein